MSATNCDTCTGLACGDECDGKSHATMVKPCNKCAIARKDCDHCGPPAWEGFIEIDPLSIPCPFCGQLPLEGFQYVRKTRSHDEQTIPTAVCTKCELTVPLEIWGKRHATKDEPMNLREGEQRARINIIREVLVSAKAVDFKGWSRALNALDLIERDIACPTCTRCGDPITVGVCEKCAVGDCTSWIKVSDRLPSENERTERLEVIVHRPKSRYPVQVETLHPESWKQEGKATGIPITHWMPMPKAPGVHHG